MNTFIIRPENNTQIGIWWYTNEKEVWAKSIPSEEGTKCGYYLQYSGIDDHDNLWSNVVYDHLQGEAAIERIHKGYKSFERGRVAYNSITGMFDVTCSKNIQMDRDFRSAIIRYFHLQGQHVDFIAFDDYYVEESPKILK